MRTLETSPDLLERYVDPSDPDKKFFLPERLDLMVTGACTMRCAGCWGPKHNSLDPHLTPEQWMQIIDFVDFNNRAERYNTSTLCSGNAEVCITGGEPLLYPGIVQLSELLAKQRVHTTLSTTGIDPENLLPSILPNIQELGVPLDGPSPEVNKIWRVGKQPDGGFSAAVSAIKLAQEDFPDVAVTLRTLIHPKNIRGITDIPQSLVSEGVDYTKLRWKFYLFNSNTGPRAGINNLKVSSEDIANLDASFEGNYPEVMSSNILAPQLPQDRMIISHNGDVHIVLLSSGGQTVDIHLGNIALDPTDVLLRINADYPEFLAGSCKGAGEVLFLDCVEYVAKAGSKAPLLDAMAELEKRIDSVRA